MSRNMKDSGVEWIGEIPEDWDTVRTKVAFKVISGATPKSGVEKYWDGDIAWVTPSDFKTDDIYIFNTNRMISEDGLNSCGTEVVPVNSIIISNRAPIGSVALNGIPLCTNQGCKSLTSIANENYNKFFYYYFSIMDSSLNMLGRGTTFLELSTFDLKNFMIPYPNYNNQQKIANFLDQKVAEIDHIISKTQASIEEYKRYKQSIITEAVTKGLDPNVPMKGSGIEWIGEIPEHWEIGKIGQIYKDRNIKVSDIDYMPLSVTKKGIVPQLESAAKTDNGDNRKLIKKNDFVINSRSDRRGSCGISNYDGSCSLINTVLEPKDYIHNGYYNYLFRSELFADEFYKWGSGIVEDLWSTKWSRMKRINIPVPSLHEQKTIDSYLNNNCSHIDHIISKKEQLINNLESYKKSLIYEVVTGKKEVM